MSLEDLTNGPDQQAIILALNDYLSSGEGTAEERRTASKLLNDISQNKIADAVARLTTRTDEFVVLVNRLDSITEKMKANGLGDFRVLEQMAAAAGKTLSQVFNGKKIGPATDPNPLPDAQNTINDNPSVHPEPAAAGPGMPLISHQPETRTEKDYADLRDEYLRFFFGAQIAEGRANAVERAADSVLADKARYEIVSTATGVPWWVIGIIHLMESSGSFRAHLHNGDSLDRRTTHVPEGRPVAAPANGTRYTWEESAADAIRHAKLDTETSWSLTRALYRFEKYNGLGYRQHRVPSPYLWSASTVWQKGKYTSDHGFDPNADSKQIGAAVILRQLYDRGAVMLYTDENEQPLNAVFKDVAETANATHPIPAPAQPSHLPDFDAFFRQQFPDLIHFEPAELLVKGSQNLSGSCAGKNTDPPQALWPNMVALVKVLEEFRRRIDAPVKLLSVYRAPDYNGCIGGADESQHKQFKAADFIVLKDGTTPHEWARVLEQMRTGEGFFKGGLKAYASFVHVDVRGKNANW